MAHLIENFFGKLKEYRGIAMRSCKTDESFSAFIAIAATVIRLKWTSTSPRRRLHFSDFQIGVHLIQDHKREVIMSRRTLTDRQWALIEPLVPGKKGDRGRTGRDNRLFIDAVLWMARTAAPWRDLPPELGN